VTTGTTGALGVGLGLVDVAAMEPRRDDGDDPSTLYAPVRALTLPQWSPVVTMGTTPPRQGGRPTHALPAAMEPRRDDGDDAGAWPRLNPIYRPQWSPVVTTGTTRTSAP